MELPPLPHAVLDLVLFLWVGAEVSYRAYAASRGAPHAFSRRRDRGSWVVLVLAFVTVFVVLLSPPVAYLWGTFPSWIAWTGLAMMLFGIAFRSWAISVLGRFFTGVVTLQPGQKVVQQGPYRWIRHPSYTGALSTFLGLPLAVASPLGLVVTLALIPAAFGYRIHVEEGMLLDGLGEEYRSYRERTWRLVPLVF